MTRFVAVAAAVFLMFGLAGCTWASKQDENSSLSSNQTEPDTSKTQQNKKAVQFALAYTGDDTLNPYKAKTSTNLNLSSLFFEGLVKIDDEMMPAPQLRPLEYPSKLTISAVLR